MKKADKAFVEYVWDLFLKKLKYPQSMTKGNRLLAAVKTEQKDYKERSMPAEAIRVKLFMLSFVLRNSSPNLNAKELEDLRPGLLEALIIASANDFTKSSLSNDDFENLERITNEML